MKNILNLILVLGTLSCAPIKVNHSKQEVVVKTEPVNSHIVITHEIALSVEVQDMFNQICEKETTTDEEKALCIAEKTNQFITSILGLLSTTSTYSLPSTTSGSFSKKPKKKGKHDD